VQDALMTEATEQWLTGVADAIGGVIVGAERLRHWGASEVWRLRVDGPAPRSVIVKRGLGEMADEARRYRELVLPLGLPAPRLVAAGAGLGPGVLVLEDVGPGNLEERPTAEGYRAAVRALARMRAAAARRLAADPGIGAGLRMSTADFADVGHRVAAGLAALRPELAGRLDGPVRTLVDRLDRLAGEPVTIVHGDFHAKNLIVTGDDRVAAVDWPVAHLHAHLGDLYSLLREADKRGLAGRVGAAALPALFAREAGTDERTVADHMVTGGLCWTLLVLRWLLTEGIDVIPESRAWLDELVADCRALAAPH
jgi:hypothetical protein